MTQTKGIESRVIETKPLKWKEFRFIQDADFKELSKEAGDKLKASLLANNFTQPFYVWLDPSENIFYCLDGYHRTKSLHELIADGVEVPEELPSTIVNCADKKEAAQLVLTYSSMYAKVTDEGFLNFVQTFDFDPQILNETIDLPGIDTIVPALPADTDPFDDPGVPAKNQYGVITICESEAEQEKVFKDLTRQGYNCKVVVT